MALSDLYYHGPTPPNLTSAALEAIKLRPNPYQAFSQGYDDQQKRDIALQQYREAKLKADLATALYPQQTQLQQAMLQAKLNYLNGGQNQYGNAGNVVTPVRPGTAAAGAGSADGDTGPLAVAGAHDPDAAPAPVNNNPGNPFSGPAPSLFQSAPALPQQAAPMIPGVADVAPYSTNPFDDGTAQLT